MNLRHKTLTRAGIVLAAFFGAALVAAPSAMAATLSGTATVNDPVSGASLSSGTSATPFEVKTNNAGKCTGSSTNGYFITGYISSVLPSTLTFDATGPHASTGLAYPLFDASQTSYVARNTGTPAPGTAAGPVLPTGALTWSLFDTSSLPPGSYHFGLACVGPTGLDNYWDSTITTTAAAGGAFNWSTGSSPVVPEVPFAALLPLSALVVLGGAFELRRRRHQESPLAV